MSAVTIAVISMTLLLASATKPTRLYEHGSFVQINADDPMILQKRMAPSGGCEREAWQGD